MAKKKTTKHKVVSSEGGVGTEEVWYELGIVPCSYSSMRIVAGMRTTVLPGESANQALNRVLETLLKHHTRNAEPTANKLMDFVESGVDKLKDLH